MIHTIDFFIVVAYLVLCLIIGFYKSTKIKSIAEYTIGAGDFATIVIMATIFATDIGPAATLGAVEKIYTLGFAFVIVRIARFLGYVVLIAFYAPNVTKFKGCISLSDIIQKLYGKYSMWIVNIILIPYSIGLLAVQLTTISKVLNFLGINYSWAVFASFSVLICYSALGGIRAVALTDVLQFFIFFLVMPIACAFLYYETGGYQNIIHSLPQSFFSFPSNTSEKLLFITLLFFSLIPVLYPSEIQRLLMAKNSKQLTKALKFIIILYIPFTLVMCFIGILMKAKGNIPNTSMTLLYLITDYLPIGLVGLMIAAILSVVMSSADSHLNTASIICSHDIIKKIFPSITNTTELLIARIASFTLGIIAIPIALQNLGILDLFWAVDNIWFPIILVPLTMGFIGFKTNSVSFIFSIITAILFTALGGYILGKFDPITIVIGVIGSAIGFFTAHYWQVKRGIIKVEKPEYAMQKPSIMQRMRIFIYKFITIKKKREISKSSYYILALTVMAINIPVLIIGYYPFSDYVNRIVQYLRYATLFLALLLLLHEMFKINNPKTLWNITLFLALPFTGTYFFISSGV